jgi:sugar lactone lactonase YvrE
VKIRKIYLTIFCSLILLNGLFAQDVGVPFDSDRWILQNAEIVEKLGRKCLTGSGYLKDVEFENGVIEVDVALSGHRSYPGIIFRVQSQANYERIYLRPHRANLYPDAVQYTPSFNGVSGWQLYNGKGYTSAATLPSKQWLRLKIEVMGKQARFYIDDQLTLLVTDLKHGISKGSVGISSPSNMTACFSNFRYRIDNNLKFDPPPAIETSPGTVTHWELSRLIDNKRVDKEKYPNFYQIFLSKFYAVDTEPNGLLDISKFTAPSGGGVDCIFARCIFRSDKKQDVKFQFGYSDEVDIFFNRKKLYHGSSGYQERDPSALGIIGLQDAVYLPFEKGLNEVFMIVTERFGGWGIMGKADRELDMPVIDHSRLTKVWETPADFKIPESVLYDPVRKKLYVTSYNKTSSANQNAGFISRLTSDGKIETLEWITGLDGPLGMGLYGDRLYVAESSGSLVEIDPAAGKVITRYKVPGARFLNDVIIDKEGGIYISDTAPGSETGVIYRFKSGQFELWRGGDDIKSPNGLFLYNDNLVVGNSGDGMLKAVRSADRGIINITCLGAGVIDGIRADNQGNLLVSHWEGKVYLVFSTGEVIEILDLTSEGLNTADFEFVKEQNLLVIPTFLGNKVVAYTLK